MYRKFKPLNIPDGWEQYWSKYPNGYSILEALIDWVSQVDDMIENQNKLTDTVKSFGERIDEFINQFGAELQKEVHDLLTEWQNSGFLNIVISEALQWELDEFKAKTEQNFLSVTQQLQQIALDVKSVGAKGDGVTDDTLAIQQALDTANTVIISAGVYLIDGTRVTIDNYGDDTVTGLLAHSNQTIIFEDGATLKVIPNNSEWYSALSFHEVHNVTVKNGVVIGERDEHVGATGEWGYGYNVVSSESIRFVDCLAKDFWGDGFLIGCTNHLIPETRSENIHLLNCVAKNNRRQGLSATGVVGLVIEGGEYSGTNGTEPASGIDLEPNSTATRVENVQLLGVKMTNNAVYGLMATTVKNLKVDKCVFSGNGRASIYTPVEIDMLVTGSIFDEYHIIALAHGAGGPVYKKQIDFIDNSMTIKTKLEYLAGVEPFLTGSLNFIRNRMLFKSGCATTDLTSSSIATELSFFNENDVTIEPSFDSSKLVSGEILFYPVNPNLQLADNTLLNQSETPLTLNGSPGFYGKSNRYIGLITDQGGRVNGDLKSVLIDMATIAPGGYGVVEISHIGVKVGDVITLTASSNSHRFYLNAQCLVDDVITIQAYNVTDTAHTLNMPVRLDIQRFYL